MAISTYSWPEWMHLHEDMLAGTVTVTVTHRDRYASFTTIGFGKFSSMANSRDLAEQGRILKSRLMSEQAAIDAFTERLTRDPR